MLAGAKARFVRGSLVLLVFLLLVLSSACGSQRTLTRTDIDARAQEYFQRGMELYQRGELRPALENFRLAKAYDSAGSNPSIAEMIDKTEARLRINSPAVAAAPALGAVPTASPRASDTAPAGRPIASTSERSHPAFISSPERRIERPSKASSSSVHSPMQINASRAVRWRPVGGAGTEGSARALWSGSLIRTGSR